MAPPLLNQVNYNSYGMEFGTSSLEACGGLFRDADNHLDIFAHNLGPCSVFMFK